MSLNMMLLVVPALLLLVGFPIFLVVLATSAAAVLFYMNVPMTVIPQIMFGSLDKFALLAVPFFIFAGEIMSRGGVSKRIVDWILGLFGRTLSARPLTAIAASEFFGAVSGSSPATVAAIGKLIYPSLREGGYGEKFSLGLITSAGGIASVMPPSILMILYGASAEQSVADLFAAGVIPALLLGFLIVFYVMWYSRRYEIVRTERVPLRAQLRNTLTSLPALGTPVIILGGIYAGIFSPTESAGIAGVYGVVVAKAIYREISWAEIWDVVLSSAKLTGQILVIVAASGVFSWLLTTTGIPNDLVALVSESGTSPWQGLLAINIMLLIVGCLLEPISAVVLFTPILVPIAQSLGIDLIHFGVIMAVNLSIGMFTPPFGLNIFTSQAIFGAKTSTIVAGVIPFIFIQLIGLALITYIPALSLFGASLLK